MWFSIRRTGPECKGRPRAGRPSAPTSARSRTPVSCGLEQIREVGNPCPSKRCSCSYLPATNLGEYRPRTSNQSVLEAAALLTLLDESHDIAVNLTLRPVTRLRR